MICKLRNSTVLFLMTVLCGSLLAQKTPDLRVDTGDLAGSHYSGNQKLAAAGSSVFAVWQDRRNGKDNIYFNRSLDYGHSWLSDPIRLDTGKAAGSSNSIDPQIVVSGNQVYVLWWDYRDYDQQNIVIDLYFNRSLDGGVTWLSQDVNLSHGEIPSYPFTSPVALAASGTSVYAAWTVNGGTTQVRFNRSLDAGSTWLATPLVIATDTSGPNLHSTICAKGSSVFVGWSYEFSVTGNKLLLNRSLDGGDNWLPQAVQVDSAPPGTTLLNDLHSACDEQHVYFLWRDSRLTSSSTTVSHAFFNRSLDQGLTWLPADIQLDPNEAGNLELAASGNSVYAIWRSIAGNSNVLFNRSLDGGASFLPAGINVSLSPNGVGAPTVSADGSLICVAWQRSNGSKIDIFANRSFDGGSQWLNSPIRLDTGDAPGNSDSTFVTTAVAANHVYAAWQDRRSGQQDIYFNLALGSQSYGTGKGGSLNFIPSLFTNGVPAVGSGLALEMNNGVGGASGFLVVGFGEVAIPLLGGTFLVGAPTNWIPLTLQGAPGIPGSGNLSVLAHIPNNAALAGIQANLQSLWLDAGSSNGISMSNGLEIVID